MSFPKEFPMLLLRTTDNRPLRRFSCYPPVFNGTRSLQLCLQDFAGKRDHRRSVGGLILRSSIVNALSFFSELTTHGDPLDANSQRALQLKQFGALFASEKCGCNTVFPCTAGASNPVDEVFR